MTVSRTKPPTHHRVSALVAAVGAALLLVSACTSPAGAGGAIDNTIDSSTYETSTPAETSTPTTEVDTHGTELTTPAGAPATSVTVTGTIATGLTTPWGLGFLPDATALVTERDTGKILSVTPDATGAAAAVRTVGTVSGVVAGGEGGLLGLAVSPHWSTDRTVYVYFTAKSDNRIAAISLAPGPDAASWHIESQLTILTGIPKAAVHNGGRITVGPDGLLYIGTGDATDKSGAQDLGYLGGKILRVDPDGQPAAGNPFPEAPLVYSYGHRNVQGLAFDSHGSLWASEFGASTYDELNLIKPGADYGWPLYEGPSNNPKYTAPYKFWPTSEASPSGLAIVKDTAVMAALRGERLWLIPLQGAAGATTPMPFLVGKYGRLRTVAVAPDGSVWLMTSNTDGRGDPTAHDDRILRLAID